MNDFFAPMPRSLAHRGNSRDFPENTEPAFRSAEKIGVDVIETDVHLSTDKEVVISHDPDFSRLSGDQRLIRDLCQKDLEGIDLGYLYTRDGGESYPFRGQGIRPLLLEEALGTFPKIRFNIDLKVPGGELAAKTADVIARANAVDRICIGSFYHSAIRAFRKALPGCATSLSKRELYQLVLCHLSGWAPSSVRKGRARVLQIPEYYKSLKVLRPGLIRWCKKRGLVIQVWTVNDKGKMKELFELGVDGIFSDSPGDLVDVCRELFP